jgi:5-methyltetrahydropteroyltriglutamate--homocysteine methyltransferase
MRTNDTRMLTTHVGSLPRSPRLTELLLRQERGEVVDETELAREVETAVETIVRKQLEVGIDIGNDGEQPRVAFHTYVGSRPILVTSGEAWYLPYCNTEETRTAMP